MGALSSRGSSAFLWVALWPTAALQCPLKFTLSPAVTGTWVPSFSSLVMESASQTLAESLCHFPFFLPVLLTVLEFFIAKARLVGT